MGKSTSTREKYLAMSTGHLRQTITCNRGNGRDDLVEIAEGILRERGCAVDLLVEDTDAESFETHSGFEQHPDFALARKYISKALNARKRGLEFSLSLAELKKLLSRKTCYYTGAPFEESGGNSLTLDRIDSTLGYVSGNVVACRDVINNIKCLILEGGNNHLKITLKEFKALADKL